MARVLSASVATVPEMEALFWLALASTSRLAALSAASDSIFALIFDAKSESVSGIASGDVACSLSFCPQPLKANNPMARRLRGITLFTQITDLVQVLIVPPGNRRQAHSRACVLVQFVHLTFRNLQALKSTNRGLQGSGEVVPLDHPARGVRKKYTRNSRSVFNG